MNISYNWLKEYINIDIQPAEVAEILTDIGLEIGTVEEVQSVKGGLEGLVIGKVLTCEKHPGADKLSKTTVDVGGEEPLPIVCGAPNVAAGQKVVVATVGTTLYSGDESFKIKKSKIRGEVSMGMICAEDEIGLGASHDGIMVLEADAPVGTPAKEFFNIETDTVFEVDLTPNRVDGSSHIGVARDLVAFMKRHKPEVTCNWPSVDNFKVDNTDYIVEVEVRNAEACPRYAGVTISGIEVKESPAWLQNRLKTVGLTPINNVVDATNFVLHECGQPLHAFDGDEIKGQKIIVDTLPENTPFVTLDEQERKLSEKDLMICNAEEGMCIAGVFGGLRSGVSEKTTKVFLESAYFNPVWVRKTAKRHTLSTDASFRFERGVDPNNTLYALKRAAMLIKEVAGGTISSDIFDFYPEQIAPFKVEVSYDHITRLIGKDLGKETIKTILEALEIKITQESDSHLSLEVPTYRVDVQREADIVEEILRIYGYNNIEMPNSVKSTLSYSPKPDDNQLKNTISNSLSANGFNEIMNNSLTKSAYYDDLSTYPAERVVKILNPLSIDLNGMRQTLLFGGLESIAYNRNRRNPDLKLYEFGNCYYYHEEKKETGLLAPFGEEQHLGLFLTGKKTEQHWSTSFEDATFYQLKAFVENILRRVGIQPEMLNTGEIATDIFDQGLVYLSKNGKPLVQLGIVNLNLCKSFDIDTDVFFADFNWDVILKAISNNKISYTEVSKFPEVKRDLALLVDQGVEFAEIRQIALATEKKLLKRVGLFDVYEGKNLPEGKKSYGVTFILQDEKKTLTDKQIDKIMKNLIRNYEQKLNAQLR